MVRTWLWLAVAAWVVARPASAAEAIVEVITGAGTVELQRGGRNTIAQEGDTVGHGAHVITGDGVAVRLLYPNGTRLTLAAKTDLEVRTPEVGAPSGALLQGSVTAAVPRNTPPALRKFFIRTNAAVMGVRGTEFVVDHDPGRGETELHTLEGSVEVGRDEADFERGKLTRVDALRHLTAGRAGLGDVRRFERAAFLRQRGERHRDVARLHGIKARSREEIAARRRASDDARRPAERAPPPADAERSRDGTAKGPPDGDRSSATKAGAAVRERRAPAPRAEGGGRGDGAARPDKADRRERIERRIRPGRKD